MSVKTEKLPMRLAALRAYCGRHRVSYAELARHFGWTRYYVSRVARGSAAVSVDQLDRIIESAKEIVWKREEQS